MLTHWLPCLAIVSFVIVAVFLRGWLQYLRSGHSGIVLFRSTEKRQLIRDAIFCLVLSATVAQTIVFALRPDWLSSWLFIQMPGWAILLASIVTVIGFAFTVAAQLGLGKSWRIGIDEDACPGLVTAGLYQICRNPIYLGMLTFLAGVTFLLPTWFSFAITLGVFVCIRTQTIQEEMYLQRMYGEGFRRYAARVGRFVPGIGKLSFQPSK